jgi:succinoglycan biosynthesis protein ExoM
MSIAICVCTYKRPQGLKRLLDSIARLQNDPATLHVCIVDNDAKGREGYRFIEENKNLYPFKISCEVEETPGISYARNHTLRMAQKLDVQYLAFTDDDIEVSPLWLKDHVRVMETYNADLVSGKSEPLFEKAPSKDILYSSFFLNNFGCPATGMQIDSAGTNNITIRKSVFDREGYDVFDTTLATSGGEDIDFTLMLSLKGYNLVQCSTGVVYETFPNERLSEDWILKRYFRGGSVYAYILKKRRGVKAFYIMALKKAIMLPVRWLKCAIKPTSMNKSILQDNYGFFSFFLTGKLYHEYAPKA